MSEEWPTDQFKAAQARAKAGENPQVVAVGYAFSEVSDPATWELVDGMAAIRVGEPLTYEWFERIKSLSDSLREARAQRGALSESHLLLRADLAEERQEHMATRALRRVHCEQYEAALEEAANALMRHDDERSMAALTRCRELLKNGPADR